MNDTILTWNMTNWITVVVMALLGFLIIGAAAQGYQKYKASKSA